MPFVAINLQNDLHPDNKLRHDTFDEADAKAREILQQFPDARVCVAEVLKDYSAKVSITASKPAGQ